MEISIIKSSAESESVLIRHRKTLRKRQGKNQSKKMNRLYFADERRFMCQ